MRNLVVANKDKDLFSDIPDCTLEISRHALIKLAMCAYAKNQLPIDVACDITGLEHGHFEDLCSTMFPMMSDIMAMAPTAFEVCWLLHGVGGTKKNGRYKASLVDPAIRLAGTITEKLDSCISFGHKVFSPEDVGNLYKYEYHEKDTDYIPTQS